MTEKYLGANVDLADDDLVADVVTIARIIDPDGGERVCMGYSEGLSWVMTFGMINAAREFAMREPEEDE